MAYLYIALVMPYNFLNFERNHFILRLLSVDLYTGEGFTVTVSWRLVLLFSAPHPCSCSFPSMSPSLISAVEYHFSYNHEVVGTCCYFKACLSPHPVRIPELKRHFCLMWSVRFILQLTVLQWTCRLTSSAAT